MYRKLLGLSVAIILGAAVSCAPDPTKPMQDAKTALEKARSVEADKYSVKEYTEADRALLKASEMAKKKQNKEAVEMAKSSKEQANKAYEIAKVNRAENMYREVASLMKDIDSGMASKLFSKEYTKSKANYSDYDTVHNSTAKNYDTIYNMGKTLKQELAGLKDMTQKEIAKVTDVTDTIQAKYDLLKGNKTLQKSSAADMKKVVTLLADARSLVGKSDLEGAKKKNSEADTLVTSLNAKITNKVK